MKIQIMSPEQLAQSLAIQDLSDPQNGVHAVNLMVDKLVNKFSPEDKIPPTVYRFCPITTVNENFDDLLFSKDSPARLSTHTRYVSTEIVLRTHTSSMIPRVVRETGDSSIDRFIFCPSLCFRKRNGADRLHVSEPHQMDIWRISSNNALQEEKLLELIKSVVECTVPHLPYTISETTKNIRSSHPYLAKVFKVRMRFNGEEISLLEGGIVSELFLKSMGLFSPDCSAICIGIMLDRAVLFAKTMPDIRLLRSQDARIKKQMLNLDPYVPVSKYPAMTRDISFIVAQDRTKEEITASAQAAMGLRSSLLEESIVLAESFYVDLPTTVRLRLGIRPDQKNVLLRLVLRSHTGTLNRVEANKITETVRQSLGN